MVYMVEKFLLLSTSVKIYESKDNIDQVIEVSVSPVTHKQLNCNDKTALVDSLFETMNLINNLTKLQCFRIIRTGTYSPLRLKLMFVQMILRYVMSYKHNIGVQLEMVFKNLIMFKFASFVEINIGKIIFV